MTTERLAQRAFDYDLIDAHQLESVWGEFGSRDVELKDFTAILVRKELLTNFQVERIVAGKRDGYFYGKYKVLYLVGSGTFSRVYRAVHRETKKVVAVKVLRQRYVDDMVTRDQFLREARMVMPLRHPNIVPIHEVDTERGRPYMVMDFVEGQNLRDFMKIRKQLDLDNALRLMIDVASGLDYALGKGVTHRDMKLSNVLISSRGRAKLVDFGLAAITADMSDDAIANAANPRSIDYAGLERATGVRKNDARSDIYFVGCMLYHMLGGKPALHETRDRIQRLSVSRYRDITPIGELAPDLPNYVAAIINRSMDLKPERRIATPGLLLKELKVAKERVEAGDPGTTLRQKGDAEEAEAVVEAPVPQEGEARTVLIVESDIDTQDQFRRRLKRRGYRVLVISDPERALQRLEQHTDEEPLCDCVVFSTQAIGDSAADAFNRFGEDEETKEIPAILLVDPEAKETIQSAKTAKHRVLLPLPVSVLKLRAALLKVLKAAG